MTKRTPIDPVDIRVGDLVERRCTYPDGITRTRVRGVVAEIDANAATLRFRIADMWSGRAAGSTVTWYLIDRPDPDAALIEVMARAAEHYDMPSEPWDEAHPNTRRAYLEQAAATLAAIRETHDVTPRAEQ